MITPTQAQIEAADRLAVKIVSLVSDAVDREGELGAYEGIECARKIKEMILALAAVTEVGIEPINRNNSTNSLSIIAAAEVGEPKLCPHCGKAL